MLGLPSCTSFSLVAESGSYSLVVVLGFSLQYRLLLWSTGSRAQAPWLWHMGLVAAQHVGSFWIRDQTCVFCTGRQILPLSHQGSPGSFSWNALFPRIHCTSPPPPPTIHMCLLANHTPHVRAPAVKNEIFPLTYFCTSYCFHLKYFLIL